MNSEIQHQILQRTLFNIAGIQDSLLDCYYNSADLEDILDIKFWKSSIGLISSPSRKQLTNDLYNTLQQQYKKTYKAFDMLVQTIKEGNTLSLEDFEVYNLLASSTYTTAIQIKNIFNSLCHRSQEEYDWEPLSNEEITEIIQNVYLLNKNE